MPVLVGITDTSFVESVTLARHSAEAGAAAVVLSTPCYFPQPHPQYRDGTAAPLVLYDMPSLTKVWFDLKTLAWL